MEKAQTVINMVRDALLLCLLIMLMVFPGPLNSMLVKAGFIKASIGGFEWEKQVTAAINQTEAAQREVQGLQTQLRDYRARIEQIGRSASEASVRSQATDLVRDVGRSLSSTEQVDQHLGQNLGAQKQLHSELKSRLR